MNYLTFIQLCRNAAQTVAHAGFFVHARREDYTLHFDEPSYRQGDVGIGLLMPTPRITVDYDNTGVQLFECLFVFMQQDAPHSSEYDREQIVGNMHQLALQYVNELLLNAPILQVSGNMIITPSIRDFAATLSGVSLALNLKTIRFC